MKLGIKPVWQGLTITFAMLVIMNGCQEEVTRKADWETHFTDLHFTSLKHGWIVGEKGFIIHTGDGGKTWHRQEVGTGEDFQGCLLYQPKIRLGCRRQRRDCRD